MGSLIELIRKLTADNSELRGRIQELEEIVYGNKSAIIKRQAGLIRELEQKVDEVQERNRSLQHDSWMDDEKITKLKREITKLQRENAKLNTRLNPPLEESNFE